jgi:hypothetical protein
VADLPAPEVTVASDSVIGNRREISVRVTPRRAGVRLLTLELTVDGGSVVASRVAGRAVPEQALGQHSLRITFHAPPDDGVQARFSLVGDVAAGKGSVSLRVIDGSDGLDGLPGFTPRPENVDAAGSHSSDLVLVSATTPLG